VFETKNPDWVKEGPKKPPLHRIKRVARDNKPLDSVEPEVLADGVNPKSIAAKLTPQRWSETRGGFNRKLVYEPLGLAYRWASRTSSESSNIATVPGGDHPR
jgi:hypothetical protein